MVNIYIGLLRKDGTEPDAKSGYRRLCAGIYDIVSKPEIFGGKQFAFPTVTEPGYGEIASVAICEKEYGGKFLRVWDFKAAQDCHTGVIPVIYNGNLYRGMEVQAKVNMNTADYVGGM